MSSHIDEVRSAIHQTRNTRSPSPVRSNDDRQVENFFNKIIQQQDLQHQTVSFILVCHMAPTLFPFLDAISKLGNIAAIIPKGFQRTNAKMIMEDLKKRLEKSDNAALIAPNINDPDPDHLKKQINNDGVSLIQEKVSKNKFIIIDIGGYFAQTFEKIILEEKNLREQLVGIVEDTENGHQKYEKMLKTISEKKSLTQEQKDVAKKIYSVARCELKKTEDYNVGKSIVEASSTILRVDGHAILERIPIAGVLGFGKIGRSIAEHLRQKHLREVVVYDPNILRQMEASSLGFKVVHRLELIMSSNMIFCATGSKCLKAEDAFLFQDNVFIASCTSSEDEFDPAFRALFTSDAANQPRIYSNILKLTLNSEQGSPRINILDSGNAVNFVYGAVNGPYIYSVQAGLIVCASLLLKQKDKKSVTSKEEQLSEMLADAPSSDANEVPVGHITTDILKLTELDQLTMESIAITWLDYFEKYDGLIDLQGGPYLIERRRFSAPQKQELQAILEKLQGCFSKFFLLKLLFDDIIKLFYYEDGFSSDSTETLINNCINNINVFLEKKQFISLIGYLSHLLLEWVILKMPEHFFVLKLDCLRMQADLLLSLSAKTWPHKAHNLKLELNRFVTQSCSYILKHVDRAKSTDDLQHLKASCTVIDFFKKNGGVHESIDDFFIEHLTKHIDLTETSRTLSESDIENEAKRTKTGGNYV